MKISIINDSQLEIDTLIKSLSGYNEFELCWIANNCESAIKKFKEEIPDLILIKLNLQFMDGSMITKSLIEINPGAILILSQSGGNNQSKIFEAMGNGALDVVAPPYLKKKKIVGSEELIKKIEIFKKLINYHKVSKSNIPLKHRNSENLTKIVAIGSSTGGPKALSTIFSNIPQNTRAAFIVIQHVDAQFANGLADWLRNYCHLPIHLAESGIIPENGNIYIANTNDHLYLNEKNKFEYSANPVDVHFRPSVDVFFGSLSKNWKSNDIAVLLTGMGYDGAKGLLELKQKGWFTIAQDEVTSVVYGMPKAAKELNAACEILPIDKIAKMILNKLK